MVPQRVAMLLGVILIVACGADPERAPPYSPSEGDGGSSTGAAPVVAPTDGDCDERACALSWPLHGVPPRDWVLTGYVDHDPSPGVADFLGGAKTYDGHTGTDAAIAGFAAMALGVPIQAAAPGVVTRVDDGHDDRSRYFSLDCTLPANLVYLDHADGSQTRYLHFRTDSIVVAVGDEVGRGALLGEVGSSGCSANPHLHFEVRDGSGAPRDPFPDGLWLAPPQPYDIPLGLMDPLFLSGGIDSVAAAWDGSGVTTVPAGAVGIGTVTGGGLAGQRLSVEGVAPDGQVAFRLVRDYDGSEHQWIHWWNVSLDAPGAWTFRFAVDGLPVQTESLTVE